MSTAGAVAVLVLLLAAGWGIDRWLWSRRSPDKLLAMLNSSNWRLYKAALLELRGRGEDILPHAPKIVVMLVSKSKTERAAAKAILSACFPDLASAIVGYS